MLRGLLARLADHRNFQAAADCFGDVSSRHPLLRNGMISASRGTLLNHQPVETGGIEPMHRRPSVHAVADVRRDALLASQSNGVGDESLLDRIVNLGKSNHRRPHATVCSEAAVASEARAYESDTGSRRIVLSRQPSFR